MLAAVVAFLFYFWSDQFLAPPDCAFYWAWADALLHGPTLNFLSSYEKLQIPAWYVYVSDTGRLANDWPMGTGLLLLPLAWAGPVWAHAWLLALLTLVLTMWWRSIPWATQPQKALSLAGLILGTPLLFYSLFGPFFSHISSFIMVTAFLVLWGKDNLVSSRCHWFKLGLLLGLATLVRPQNVLLGLVFLADSYLILKDIRSNPRQFLRHLLLPAAAGLALGLAPRFPAYDVLYGHPFALPKLEEMHWLNPNFALTLLSDYHGILPWTPVYAIGVLGLLWGMKDHKRLSIGLMLVLATQFYINAANEVWWSGGSFGNRRLTDYSIAIAWGVAFLLSAKSRPLRIATIATVAICSAWTFTLLLAERRLIVPLDRYIPFSAEGFLSRLADVYLQPAETWRSLTRAVSNSPAERLGAAALLFLVIGGTFTARPFFARFPGAGSRSRVILALTALLLTIWVSIAALNTPAIPPSLRSQFARSSPILWDNYTELAGYHLVKEDFAAANEVAEKAIRLRPEAATGYWYSGVALLQGGRPAEAAERFSEVLKLEPGHHNAGQLLEAAQSAAGKTPTNEESANQQEADWRVQ